MDKDFFKISGIRSRIERNHDIQIKIKGVAASVVFSILLLGVLCTIQKTRILLWLMSLPAIVVLFLCDASYVKKNKEHEYEIYRLEVERLERKKEIAEIKGIILEDYEVKHSVKFPTPPVLPIYYYVILLILDCLIGLLIVR